MKVKIGDTWYYPETTPILLVLNEDDKSNINKMKVGDRRYAISSKDYFRTDQEFEVWLDAEE